MKLLSTTSRIETPFIAVTIGKYNFGVFNKEAGTGIYTGYQKYLYPNYVQSLNVVKTNGSVNTYTLTMKYQITTGDDPNFLEKVFSTQSNERRMIISYGDYSSPSFLYKEEGCTITDVKSNIDFGSSAITYTVTAISDALSLTAGIFNFPRRKAKPSDIIKELLYRKSYGIQDVFYGMRDADLVTTKGMIASDDKEVNIDAKQGITVFDYINYLVKCMTPASSANRLINSGIYNLIIHDDYSGEIGGPYFTIKRINTNVKSSASLDTYEIDIGYPSLDAVLSFSIDDNQTYSILYNYQKDLKQSDYIYRIDDNGKLISEYSPAISNNPLYQRTTQTDKNWWTQVTQYPIKATLVLKGLLKAAMLMSYVKINTYFYGQKHISSGLYVITRQEDSISADGYRTTLSLTRITGDENI